MNKFVLNNSILYNDNCFAVFDDISDNSINLIFADLPYGTTSCEWDIPLNLEKLWKQYWRILTPNGVIILTATQPFTSKLVLSQEEKFKHEWIWHKSKCGSAFTSKYRPQAKHESVLIFGNGKIPYYPIMKEGTPYKRTKKKLINNNHKFGFGKKDSTTINLGTRFPESVLFFQQKWRRQDQTHPTQKPIELCSYFINTYSKEGDTVLDNVMGTGSTGIAAIKNKRKFIGIELHKPYFDVACEQIKIQDFI